jgi:ankyrin repeat protein
MLKKLSLFFATLFIGITGFLIIPTSFSTTKIEFPKEEPIKLIPNEQNKGERCKPNTVYYSESNGYTESGEGEVNQFCAKIHSDLKKAIEKNDISQVKTLLEKGANVNSLNDDYDLVKPIIVSVREKNFEITKVLLDNDANANEIYKCCASDKSALQIAISNNDLQITKLLLERGANLYFKGHFGGSVFETAKETGNQEIITILENACENDLVCRAKFRFSRIVSLFSKSNQLAK